MLQYKKKKFTISNNQTKNNSSLEKFSKNKNKTKNIKIIEDDSFEEEIKVVEKNIRKTKKQKQKYPKDDDDYNNEESSLDSISTNKTDDFIFKKEIRYPKNDLNQSISNAPRKKEKSINKKITLDENGFKRRKKTKIISRNKNKSQNKNKRNTISIFKNPYLEEEEDEKSTDNTDNYDESDFEYDSDYYKQEIKKEKKSNGKKYYKKDKEDIFDDNIYSKSSILGLDYLPCREKEQKIIYDYIKNGLLTNGNYNSLYIAGMPGTGKTACVKTVINIMESELNQNNKNIFKKNSKNNYIPPFTKLFICGTEFPSISNVFRAIYNFIFSTKKKQTNKKYK